MPLHVERLLASDTWLMATGDEAKAAITLWCRAWHQVPAGSLPNDDRLLAALSGAGSKWRKVKAVALRGFALHEDGRLYHAMLCEEAKTAYERRLKWRKKKQEQREGKSGDVPQHVPGDNGGDKGVDKQEDKAGEKPLRDGTGRDGTDISVPSERPVGGFLDLKTELFKRGKAYLIANGVPPPQAGSIIGRWRKTHDDATILNAFLQAETECALQPIEFITGVLRHAAGKNKRPAPFDAVLAAASGVLDRGT